MIKRNTPLLVATAVFPLLASLAQAETYTWIGESTSTPGVNRWNRTGNWVDSLDAAATLTSGNDTDVIFQRTGTSHDPGSTFSNYTFRSMTFDESIDGSDFSTNIWRNGTSNRSLTFSSDTGTSTMTVDAGATANIAISGGISNGTQNNIILNSNLDVVHNGSGLLNLAARVSGANDINKLGTGVLKLSSANNDYTGATTVTAGTLVFANKGARSTSAVTAAATGTVGLGVGAGGVTDYSETDVADLFNTNTLTGFTLDAASGVALDTTTGDFTQSTALTAARALTKLGDNTLTLSGSNSYTGATNVNAGTLSLTGSLTGGGAIAVGSSGALSQSAAGVISGASSVTTSGTTTLSGANTYSGDTTLSEGTLNINSTTALGTGTFALGNGTTIDNTSGGAITLTNNNAITIAGNVNGNYFTFGGTDDLNLGTGAVTLQLPQASGASIGTIQLNGVGSTLTFGGAVTSPARGTGQTTIQVDGAGNTLVFGSLGLNERGASSNNIWSGSADVTVNGGVLDTGGGTKSFAYAGTGTFTMGGAGNYTGNTTVSSGTLQLGHSLAIQNSALNAAGSTVGDATNGLKTTVTTLTFGGITGDKDLASIFTTTSGGYGSVTELTLNNAGNSSYSGAIADGASGMDLNKTGSGTQTLSGTNTYTGATNVSGGILVIEGTGSINGTSGVNVDSAATLNYNSSTTLTAAISFVGTGNTLSGSGTIDSAVTISSGNILAIGNSPGTMVFGDTLTLAGSTIMEVDGTAGAGVVGGHDFADVTNALTYGGALTLDISTTFAVGDYTFNLFDFGSETGTFASIVLADQYSGSFVATGGVWDYTDGTNTWQFDETSGELDLDVVPEPSTFALLAGLLGFSFVMVRRRRA